MKSIFTALLLVGLASTAPVTESDDLVINEEFFPDRFKTYTAEHDIVKICVPLNNLNFEETKDNKSDDDGKMTIFFVEADINDNEYVDQGLYVKIGEQVTKLLDHGRDIAAPIDESKNAYFAAKDGIYSYNAKENKAEKYGSVTEDLIGIAVANASYHMFVLSADKKVYRVVSEGNKLEKIAEINNAEQIILDYANNLFYIDSHRKLYVINADGLKHIEGIPTNGKITLLKPPFMYDEGGIPVVADKKTYTVYPNGTVEKEDIIIETEITAYSLEAFLFQYYAKEKKLYEYNVLVIYLEEILKELKDFLETKEVDIQEIATRNRKNFFV